VFTPAVTEEPASEKWSRTITLVSHAPSVPWPCPRSSDDVITPSQRKVPCTAGHSRVWHDGHVDCLVGDELVHVGVNGARASHGHVWNLDTLLELYGKDVVPAELAACDHPLIGMMTPDSLPAPHVHPAQHPVSDALTHRCSAANRCKESESASASPSPTQFLHDGHVDYLVGNHLHHPTEGCHGPVSDEVLATVGLAAVGMPVPHA
jgi:hypothetical protein